MLIDYGLELLLALFIGSLIAGYLHGLKRGKDDAVDELLTAPVDDAV